MGRLTSIAWRSLAARRLRSILTVVGIALGVAVLYASLANNSAIDASVGRTVAAMLGTADFRVSTFAETGLRQSTVEAIGATPGVLVAGPEVERRTYLQPGPGSVSTGLQPPVTVLGIDPRLDALLHPPAIAAGNPLVPGESGTALISERLAREDGLGIGDSMILGGQIDPAQSTVRIVGLVAGDGRLPGGDGRLVMVPVDLARTLFGLEGVTRVDVAIAPGASRDQVIEALEAQITTQPYLLSTPEDLRASLRAATAEFQATTGLIAAVALFVGAFLIYNTLSMTIGERLREVGLLRAAGATRRQVAWLIVLQALVLGLLGSLLGVLLGGILAVWLGGAFAAGVVAIGGIAQTETPVSVPGLVLSIGVGIVVTLAAALEPAWRASRIAPIEALRRTLFQAPVAGARLAWVGIVFLVVGVAGLALWPSGGATAGLLRSLGVYALLLLVTLLSPIILPALSRIVGAPLGVAFRAEERLARNAIGRDPARTALTVGALTIGLAMIVAIGAIAQSDRRAAESWLEEVIPGETLLTSIRPIGATEGIEAELAGLPGVERVSPIGRFDLAVGRSRVDAAAVVGTDLLVDERLRIVVGDRRAALLALDEGGSAVLPRSLAEQLGVTVGSELTALAADGSPRALTVSGIAERTIPGRAGETVLVGWSDAVEQFGVEGADALAVRYQPGREADSRSLLESSARQLALEPSPLSAAQGAASDTLAQLFAVFDVLAAVAVVIAGFGIVNTLTMSVLERVREIGVLRAAGMTRRQVWRMVLVEAAVIGIAGAILGVLLGLLVAAFMLALAGGFPLVASLDPPWVVIGLSALFGVLVAVAAAWYPARVASRMSIVRAVQFE